jgi:RNA polymerase sigma factor (sigma-70 family)
MAAARLQSVLLHLRRLVASQAANKLPDEELLEQFVRQREETAFAALVQRHGPMVLSVCRRVLAQQQDAEDACQATFLVLARKAAAIRKRGSLASWLHGVAYRVARKLGAGAAHAAVPVEAAELVASSDPAAEAAWRETRAVLDEELEQLPARYRAPLTLCYLEGLTQAEAARQLGWGAGVLRGRLDRGRECLRARLVKRGVTVPAALVGGTLAGAEVTAAVPAAVVAAVARAAVLLAAGQAAGADLARVGALAELVLRGLAISKAKTAAAVVLVLACLGLGAGVFAYHVAANRPPEGRDGDQPQPLVMVPDPDKAGRPRTDFYGDPLPPGALLRLGTWRLHGDADSARGLAVSPDGKQLAAIEVSDREIPEVVIWQLPGGKELGRLKGVPVGNAAFSPDGKLLVVAGGFLKDGISTQKLMVLEMPAGKIRWKKDGKADAWFGPITFSPDGTALAVSSYQLRGDIRPAGVPGVIEVWAVSGLLRFRAKAAHESYYGDLSPVAFSPDGKLLAANAPDGSKIVLRDAATGNIVRILANSRGDAVQALRFTPEGKKVFAFCKSYVPKGPDRETIDSWDARTGQRLTCLEATRALVPPSETEILLGLVRPFAFSPDCRFFVAANLGNKKTLVALDLTAGGRITFHPMDDEFHWPHPLAFSADSSVLAVRSQSGILFLHSLKEKQRRARYLGHVGPPNAVAFSRDGSLATGDSACLRLWDGVSGKETNSFLFGSRPGDQSWAKSVAFSPSGRFVAVAVTGPMYFGTVELRDVSSGRLLKTFESDYMRFLPGDVLLTQALVGGNWPPKDKEPPRRAGKPPPPGIEFDFYSVPKGRVIRTLTVSTEWVNSGFDISPDGKTLAVSPVPSFNGLQTPTPVPSALRHIDLYDVPSGKKVRSLNGFRGDIGMLAFFPDGKRLLSWDDGPEVMSDSDKDAFQPFQGNATWFCKVGPDKAEKDDAPPEDPDKPMPEPKKVARFLRVHQVASGAELVSIPFTHGEEPRAFAVSPTGKWFALVLGQDTDGAITDLKVHLFESTTGKERARWAIAVNALAFSPDGQFLAGAGQDGIVYVWDPATGQEVHRFAGNEGPVTGLAFSADGRRLASISGTGLVWISGTGLVWDVAGLKDRK